MLNRENRFLIPGVIKSVAAYKFPYRMMPYRAMLVWNKLYPHKSIPDYSTINILHFKGIGVDPKKDPEAYVEAIREKFPPKMVEPLIELLEEHEESINSKSI